MWNCGSRWIMTQLMRLQFIGEKMIYRELSRSDFDYEFHLIRFGENRVPNFNDLYYFYVKIQKPYTKKTLPNLRFVGGCWNCKHGEGLNCGSHYESDCGICREYVGEYRKCDLWEEKDEN